LPNTIVDIGDRAFSSCKAKSINIPDSVRTLGYDAFFRSGIESITIPPGITTYDITGLLQQCKSLRTINLNNSNVAFGFNIYAGCDNLENINIYESHPSLRSIDGVMYSKNASILYCLPFGRSGKFTVPGTVTELYHRAFEDCKNITEVILPDTLLLIGNSAFANCNSLMKIRIPQQTTFSEVNFKANLLPAFGWGEGVHKVIIQCYANSPAHIYAQTYEYQFELISLTITYNANSGIVSPASTTVNAGSSVTTPTPTKSYTLTYNVNGGNAVSPPSKNVSCTANGWFTATIGGTKRANAGASYTPTQTETIYAQWTNPTMGTLPTPTHPTPGYTFKGWFTAASGGTQVTSSTVMTGNQTIYAQWNAPTIDIYNIGEETYSFKNYGDSDSPGGHCFGMSVTSGGYVIRRLDIAIVGGNYTDDLYALSATATVKAPICTYQKSQTWSTLRTPIVAGDSYDQSYQTSYDIQSDWPAVVNYAKGHSYDGKGSLHIIIWVAGSGGHAVNFLRYEEVNGQARIYAYDNNFPTVETYFYKDASGKVRQAPNSTFGNSVIDSIGLHDTNKSFDVVSGINATKILYAETGSISVEGVTPCIMTGDFELGQRVSYELPPNLTEITITPLVDNASFEYLDNTYSFGNINAGTIGIFTLATQEVGSFPNLTITERPAQTYTLTLNANGGSVTPTTVTQATGATYTLPTPTRAGYTFTGWTLSGGGSLSGSIYTFGASNGTVTAGWTPNSTPPTPPAKGIFGTNTKWYGEWWHYLLFFLCFGFIWMWF